MDTMTSYQQAQDKLDSVLSAVGPDQWDGPSACSEWTVRDVAGHLIWGQHQLRAWATGADYTERAGAPGSPNPGVMAGEDPVETWRAARAASVPTLTEEALARTTTITGIGEVSLAALLSLMITDTVTHTWDIAHGIGLGVQLDPALVAIAFDWGRRNVVRRPGFFGPELTAPGDADDQTWMLAFLGRAAWEPVAA
ncbi:TIGR03086 family metal-binding protein [Kibdelosporangium aridum]|uniref:TIGR03086 family protein n=1 Tax=Kibdelosporangium aridum TaxID=2030 RepID=A0A1W2FXQ5_KIBAR|nr:TIGR03086 family metal-binding protein [Kibdelosporangium aridum]SMD26574.1 TIGR03086 family protein [Kibdelosporangium aridum]